jgi:transketolase
MISAVDIGSSSPQLDDRSVYLRKVVLDSLGGNRRAHIASAFSIIEILRAVYDHVGTFDPSDELAASRDRFILSKGHGCLALYAVLADKGYFHTSALSTFSEHGSMLGGHPERHLIPGVEVSTGALGHGLPVAVGMALAAKIRRDSHRLFVLVGDGECNEGSNWEAAVSAAHHGLSNLTVLVDCNGFQSFGSTRAVADMEPMAEKWRAFGFHTSEVDGHDIPVLAATLRECTSNVAGRPSAVICRTLKGKGIPSMEASAEWHYRDDVDDKMLRELKAELAARALQA